MNDLKTEQKQRPNVISIWPYTTRASNYWLVLHFEDGRQRPFHGSLADEYDPLAMPPGLLKSHQTLDRAVIKLWQS